MGEKNRILKDIQIEPGIKIFLSLLLPLLQPGAQLLVEQRHRNGLGDKVIHVRRVSGAGAALASGLLSGHFFASMQD